MSATITHLPAPLRRVSVRAGGPPPPDPSERPSVDATLRALAHSAHDAGYADGEREGYVAGWRWGVMSGAACASIGAAIGLWFVLSIGLLRWAR